MLGLFCEFAVCSRYFRQVLVVVVCLLFDEFRDRVTADTETLLDQTVEIGAATGNSAIRSTVGDITLTVRAK